MSDEREEREEDDREFDALSEEERVLSINTCLYVRLSLDTLQLL